MRHTTECHTCGGGTGQPHACYCASRAALEADKLNTRRKFVAKFVAERINAGTWPETDPERLVMLSELIDAWENRNKDR